MNTLRPDTPAETPPLVQLGLWADAHCADKVYGDRHCSDSLDKLRRCVDLFNERGLTLAVGLGDCIDSAGNRDEDLAMASAVREVLSAFRGQTQIVVGNHDLHGLTKPEFLRAIGAAHPRTFYSFDCMGSHLIIMDGNFTAAGEGFGGDRFAWDDAWLSERQLRWLADDLRQAEDRPAVVFCHENVDDRLWGDAADPHVLRNAGALRDILGQARNVRAIVQGHYHPGLLTSVFHLPCIGMAAMVVGPGPENNAFGILTVHADGSVQMEGFGRQPSFHLRRTPPAVRRLP